MAYIYFSNDLNRLAEHFGNQLFGTTVAPFSNKIVIVPKDRYKGYLQHFFAKNEKFQVAAGMQIMTLPAWLSQRSAEDLKKISPPYALLEHRLYCLVKQLELEPLKKLSDQQLRMICRDLSQQFHKYGTHGEKFLKGWLQKQGWQQTLWRAVYENSSWSYPLELFEKTKSLQNTVHLFGFSSMPSAQALFFKKQGAVFYLFSPCRLFWGDLLNAKERARMGVIEDEPMLLSSWGKWGKRLLNVLSAEEMDTEEDYVEPDSFHALGAIQKSLLDLEPPELPPGEEIEKTIRIFSAGHRLQEVEEVYEEIHRILLAREDLAPSDILVLAPDINSYVPYLHAVFGEKGSGVDYAIRGIEEGKRSVLAAGVQFLFHLVDQQWSLEALVQLFSHSLFAQKRTWKKADLEQIEQWLSKARATWGFDEKQRKQYLHAEDSVGEAGTIRFALDRLLFGLTSTETTNTPTPISELDWTDVELFSTLIETMENLSKDLTAAIAGEEKALHEWLGGFIELIDRHFVQDEEPWLKEQLLKVRHSCKDWQHRVFTWQDIRKICEDIFSEKSSSYQPHLLNAVQFDALDEGMIIDQKVIVLMGMQDGSFPRQELDSSLDELDPKAPSRGEIDRFLFLEALVKTKEIFIISFLHTCPEKHIEIPASLVVQELQKYIEKWKAEVPIRVLPERKFTSEALEQAPYFSVSRYREAKAYAQRKQNASWLIRDWHEEVPLDFPVLPEENVIDLADLRTLLKDPVEFFFKKTLGFRIQWNDECSFHEEEFCISRNERNRLLEASLSAPLSEVIKESEREKVMLLGAFKEMALHKLDEEHEVLLAQTKKYQIDPQNISDLQITPWRIDLGLGKSVVLHGKIEGVGPLGIMEFFEKNKKDQVFLERWSDLLVLKGHPELQHIPSQILFVQARQGATKELGSLDPVEELKKLLSYYALCKKRLSPFLPQWSKSLLEADSKKVENEFDNTYLSKHALWLIKRDGAPSAMVLCNTWSSYLQSTFSHLKEMK